MKIITGIASTTHLDRHFEKMSKMHLDDFALRINEVYIPQLIEHDWNRQVGVNLYGEVFQLADGEYALGVVSGEFENQSEKDLFKNGDPNTVANDYKKYLNIENLIKINKEISDNQESNVAIPDLDLAQLLEIHLDSTSQLPNGDIYKTKRFIAGTDDLKVYIYPKDHLPAHFHVISKQRNIDARFDIYTLELINMKKGNIKNVDIKKIKNFFETNPLERKKLITEYERLQ